MHRLTALGIAAVTAAIIACVPACSRKSAAAQTSGTSAPLSTPPQAPKSSSPPPAPAAPPAAAPAQAADVQPPAASDIQAAADAYKAVADSMPRALTDVDALASTLTTPQAAFAFVRDQIALEPYSGAQKGARGTLLTRGGNDLDRALLLAELLKHQNVDVKIAHGALTPDQAQQLLTAIVAAPDALHQQIAALLQVPMPGAPNAAALKSDLPQPIADRANAMWTTIDRQYAWLSSQLKNTPLLAAGDPKPMLTALQDHYWVVATVDGGDEAFDPSFNAAQPGQTFATADASFAADDLPDAAKSTITFRLAAEYLEDGKTTPVEALNVSSNALDLVGKSIRFSMAPQKDGVAKAKSFVGTLAIGDDSTKSEPVQLRRSEDQSGGGPLGGFGGGFGAALGGGAPAAKDAPPLARLTLVMTWHSPHAADETYGRVIVDRLGADNKILPAYADEASVRVQMLQAWDAASWVGPIILPYMARQDSETLSALAAGTRTVESAKAQHAKVQAADLPKRRQPSDLLHLLLLSDYARASFAKQMGTGCVPFYAGVRLAFVRHGFQPVDVSGASGKVAYEDGVDIVNSPFGFACKAGASAAQLALKAGVADTTFELFARRTRAVLNTIALLARPGTPPTVVARSASGLPGQLTAAAPLARVLKAGFDRGALLVGPSGLIVNGERRNYGWWEVDNNGCAIGRADLGGGQAMTERAPEDLLDEEVQKDVTQLFGNFVKCLFTAVVKELGEKTWEGIKGGEGEEGGGQSLDDKAGEEIVGCMAEAVCDELWEMGSERIGEGLLDKIVEEQRTDLIKLSQRFQTWSPFGGFAFAKGCEAGGGAFAK